MARTSGNDVILDALLLRLHTETACRRGGALGLQLMDRDVEHGLVRLAEKGGTLRWQPISLNLAICLAEHAAARGAVLPSDGLLRFRHGRAVTSRRYATTTSLVPTRPAAALWVAVQGISTHWLRQPQSPDPRNCCERPNCGKCCSTLAAPPIGGVARTRTDR